MADRALIRLPWPPSKTSKNGSQANYIAKAKAAKSYKRDCAVEIKRQAIQRVTTNGDVPVVVTYYPPSNHRNDWDNLAGRAKQGFDAIAEATGVDDGRWWPVLSAKGERVDGGCIMVEINPPRAAVSVPLVGQIT